jgi:hypothetical protein
VETSQGPARAGFGTKDPKLAEQIGIILGVGVLNGVHYPRPRRRQPRGPSRRPRPRASAGSLPSCSGPTSAVPPVPPQLHAQGEDKHPAAKTLESKACNETPYIHYGAPAVTRASTAAARRFTNGSRPRTSQAARCPWRSAQTDTASGIGRQQAKLQRSNVGRAASASDSAAACPRWGQASSRKDLR